MAKTQAHRQHSQKVATKLIRGGMDKDKAKRIGDAAARKKCGR